MQSTGGCLFALSWFQTAGRSRDPAISPYGIVRGARLAQLVDLNMEEWLAVFPALGCCFESEVKLMGDGVGRSAVFVHVGKREMRDGRIRVEFEHEAGST